MLWTKSGYFIISSDLNMSLTLPIWHVICNVTQSHTWEYIYDITYQLMIMWTINTHYFILLLNLWLVYATLNLCQRPEICLPHFDLQWWTFVPKYIKILPTIFKILLKTCFPPSSMCDLWSTDLVHGHDTTSEKKVL